MKNHISETDVTPAGCRLGVQSVSNEDIPLPAALANSLNSFLRKIAENGSDLEEAKAKFAAELMSNEELNEGLREIGRKGLARFRAELPKGGISISGLDPRDPATRLRLLLRRKCMTQNDLAGKLGIDPAVLSRSIRNLHKCRPATLQRIAGALKVDAEDLFWHK